MPTYGMPAAGKTAFTPDGLGMVGPVGCGMVHHGQLLHVCNGELGQLGGQGGLPGGSDT